jgi:hypothetical protein
MCTNFVKVAQETPSMPSSDQQQLRLPEYFPRKPKECLRPADSFFKCFNEKSQKSEPNDSESGARGLSACAKELEKYKYCMDNTKSVQVMLAKAQYRVQEEYRTKDST